MLHAMGAAIPRALELALEAVSESASLSESTSRGAGSTGAVQAGGCRRAAGGRERGNLA